MGSLHTKLKRSVTALKGSTSFEACICLERANKVHIPDVLARAILLDCLLVELFFKKNNS